MLVKVYPVNDRHCRPNFVAADCSLPANIAIIVVISVSLVCCGDVISMREVFSNAEDTEIDVPRIWQYLAEIISPMIKADGALPLNFFYCATESVRLSRKVSHLIADVLYSAASRLVC